MLPSCNKRVSLSFCATYSKVEPFIVKSPCALASDVKFLILTATAPEIDVSALFDVDVVYKRLLLSNRSDFKTILPALIFGLTLFSLSPIRALLVTLSTETPTAAATFTLSKEPFALVYDLSFAVPVLAKDPLSIINIKILPTIPA